MTATATEIVSLSDSRITFTAPYAIDLYDDDGDLQAHGIARQVRQMFPQAASVTCEEGAWEGDYVFKVIPNLSFDSPLLYFLVWEEPAMDEVGIARIDPSTGRVLQTN